MSYSPIELANAYLQAGEFDDALDTLNEVLASTPDDEALRLRASILSRRTDALQRALDDLNLLTSITPDDLLLRSTLHSKLGEDAAALDVMRTAHTQFPAHDRITERLLYLLREGGLIAEAREIALPDGWRWSQWAGDLARDADDLPAAIDHYTAAISTLEDQYPVNNPNDAIIGTVAHLYATRGDAHDRAGNLDAAEADYALALSFIPDDTLIQLSQAILTAKRGDLSAALTACEAILNAMPESLRRTYALPRLRATPFSGLQKLANQYSE